MNEQYVKEINGYKIKDEEARNNINELNVNTKVLGNINLKNLLSLEYSDNDLYEGYPHNYLQGFCYVDNKIIMALRSSTSSDNYVRLVKYDLENHTVIDSEYLILNHANSITYNINSNKLYVASCNKVVEGEVVFDNAIFVVDYDTFTIDDVINVTNIPENHRIRSVYYDNVNEILYGGDIYDIFVIDRDTGLITDTINLDTKYIDTSMTNQTFKRYENLFVGLWLGYLAFWDLEGNLVRIINLEQIYEDEHMGEYEDFDFDDNGNIIIGCAKRLSPRLDYITTNFYISNFNKNISSSRKSEMFKADTSALTIYVNSESLESKEDGTIEYPYKNIQRAINIIKNSGKYATLKILGGTYDNVYLTGCNLIEFEFSNNVTLNGLEVSGSNVTVYRTGNTGTLTIYGIRLMFSDFHINGNCIINPCNNENLSYYNNTIYSKYSNTSFENCTINGNNSEPAVYFAESKTLFNNCVFANYEGTYAVDVAFCSDCILFDNTFNISSSNSQHLIYVRKGSNIYTRNGMRNVNDYVIQEQGRVYPSNHNVPNIQTTFLGEVCSIDTHYTHCRVEYKIAGTNVLSNYIDIDISDGADRIITSHYLYNGGIRFGNMVLNITNNKLVISSNKSTLLTTSQTFSQLDTNNPATPQDWIGVTGVSFYNL